MRLLLASKSEARQRMLQAAGVSFELADAPLDEAATRQELGNLAAGALAGALAEAKALSVKAEASALVLGSDQTLEREDGSMLNKPASREEALQQLRSLSGSRHQLHAAAAVAEGGRIVWSGAESVALTVRPLSDQFLEAYLDREYEAIRWSVGGYRIEEPGVQLFERIHGSHFAILGMPLLPLLGYFRERRLLPS